MSENYVIKLRKTDHALLHDLLTEELERGQDSYLHEIDAQRLLEAIEDAKVDTGSDPDFSIPGAHESVRQ